MKQRTCRYCGADISGRAKQARCCVACRRLGRSLVCLNCGADISIRGASAKRCEPCAIGRHREESREERRRWRAVHTEQAREQERATKRRRRTEENARKRRWRAEHPEQCREWKRRWRAANTEKYQEEQRRWRTANPEKNRENNRRREAKKRQLLGTVSPNIERVLLRRQNNRCLGCCRAFGPDLPHTLDHIMPFDLGGLHDDPNLQLLCGSCNSSKGAKHPDEWEGRER